ncbi:hypothetical protein LT330_001625 [Penicillium expansum]|nr:hypothetical protein LT330_001625 [Penicillium expansum]
MSVVIDEGTSSDIALECPLAGSGFTDTQLQQIAALIAAAGAQKQLTQGPQGPPGRDGVPGRNGYDGVSAFPINTA